MKLKLACADFTFPLLPHDHVLDLIAGLGIEGVDVGVFGERSHLRLDRVAKDIRGSARELSAKIRDRGLELSDIFLIPGDFRTLAPNDPAPGMRSKSRDLFQRILEFTARCNAPHMTGLPGVHWEEESLEPSLERASDDLAWRVEQAKQVGVTFSVEPHIHSVVPTPPEAERLVKMTPGLTLTLDYGHFTYLGIADAAVEPLLRHSSHFQARGACKSRPQASFKENTIDFARVLRAMKRFKYRGYVALEYVWIEWEHCNEVDNLSETILLRDFLRSVKL